MTLTIGLVIAIMAFLTALLLLLPRMARPTVPFGVRVPGERTDDPVVRQATGQYYVGVVVTMAVVTAALAALALIVPRAAVVLAASIVPLVAWLVPYLSARRVILTAKRDGGWFADTPHAIVTDTTWRTSPPPLGWTINFGRPMAWVLTAGFLALTIGAIVWAILAESASQPAAATLAVAHADVLGPVAIR